MKPITKVMRAAWLLASAMMPCAQGVPTQVIPAMPANPPPNWMTYHLVHPGPEYANPGDPNCAFYWKGKYHLHYIYKCGGVNFAHVSSDDMVHW